MQNIENIFSTINKKGKGVLIYFFSLFKREKLIIYDVNKASFNNKRCLLIYITHPFLCKKVSYSHQNQWQAVEMARIIGNYGFVVDVADYQSKNIELDYSYDLIIGLIPRGINIYSQHMNANCILVAYLTSMNLEYTSKAGEKRIEELYKRRGVKLQPRRFAGYIQKDIENFDAAWYIGNEYNFHSYDSFKMPPVFYIKNSGYTFEWVGEDQRRDPKTFLFFGSLGAVHKGLDLLLEIFAENVRDCTLYVCGCYLSESDFCKEYHKELFETSNIISVGFVDIESSAYKEIAGKCAFTLLPSCAEGCAGSVLTNMSAGIIPIVSKECGFDDDEVINLPDCKKETIIKAINEYCMKSKEWIIAQSEKAIEVVKNRYSERNFTESVENALKKTLELRK